MKFSSFLQSALLLVGMTTALDSPPRTHTKLMGSSSSSKLTKKELAAAVRNEHFSKKAHSRDFKNSRALANTVETDANWAGATISPPSGQTFKSVTGTMTLPKMTEPSTPVGPGGEYFLYVWVGIDGDGDCDGLWQTGFAGQIDDGVESWWGWVCFISDSGITFDTMILDASTGDHVNMTVEALSSSEGIFWLENISTGKTESYDVSGGNLCMESAEWIVEDPFAEDSNGDVDYFLVWPDFGTMTFDNAVAYTNKGTAVGPEDAEFWVVDNYYSGVTQNSVSVTDDTVSVTWLASGPGT